MKDIKRGDRLETADMPIRLWNMLREYEIRTLAQLRRMPLGESVQKFGPTYHALVVDLLRKLKRT